MGKSDQFVVGNIVDLLNSQDNINDVVSALISVACNHFRIENVDMARNTRSQNAILITGFFRSLGSLALSRKAVFRPKYEQQLIYYLTSRDIINKAFKSLPYNVESCWYLMQGDTDYM